ARGAPRFQLADDQLAINRITRINRFQKTAALFQKPLQRLLHHVRKQTGAGCRLNGNLKAVCQQSGHTLGATILDIVMDRMIIAAGQLKGSKQCLSECSRWQYKTLTDYEVFEVALFAEPMGKVGSRRC